MEIFKYLCSIQFEIVDFNNVIDLHVIDLSGINDKKRDIETVYGTGTVYVSLLGKLGAIELFYPKLAL